MNHDLQAPDHQKHVMLCLGELDKDCEANGGNKEALEAASLVVCHICNTSVEVVIYHLFGYVFLKNEGVLINFAVFKCKLFI